MMRRLGALFAIAIAIPAAAMALPAPVMDTVYLRGHAQIVHLYGVRGGDPVIVSSGDGGWMHLAPHVAEALAARGFFVVGVDVRAYLASFTSATGTLRPQDEPDDYHALIEYASRGSTRKPLLIGVSEGAGLSVLAAGDPATRSLVSGVIALGLPDLNELDWRWKDSVIYVTHGVPKEPTFSTASVVGRMSPLPLAEIHATSDEFVPVPEVQRVMQQARDPKRLWIVTASNHRFSDNLSEFDRRLVEAIDWVRQNQPR